MLLIYFDFYNKQHVTFHLSFVGSGGLSFLQFCNLNSFRTKFVLGFSIFLGLSIPQYFNEYTAINGFGPVHTGARWVWLYGYLFIFLLLFTSPCAMCHIHKPWISCHVRFMYIGYKHFESLMYLAVQWYSKCAVPIKSFRCWSCCIFLG